MAKAELPSCRLYGILAREAPIGVLFRRGPSKEVQVILWDVKSDRFETGQWFKGRIYERRCDLSPDGQLMVYFAASWKARLGLDAGSWTAVSRPPYLTALARWVKGDAWSGGGLFINNSKLGLNNGGSSHRWPDPVEPRLPISVTDLNLGRGEDDPIETEREKRDGWNVVQEMDVTPPNMPSPPPRLPLVDEDGGAIPIDYLEELSTWLDENRLERGFVTHQPRILEKPSGALRLRREERLERYKVLRKYELLGAQLDLANVEWAEWDYRQRLVFAREGGLYAVALGAGNPPEAHLLADFNANRFTPVEAPRVALEWPKE